MLITLSGVRGVMEPSASNVWVHNSNMISAAPFQWTHVFPSLVWNTPEVGQKKY